MADYFNLFIRAAFVENLALSFFLGMCTFLAISKRVETAIGLGLAVVAVQTITVPVNYLIFAFLLDDGALAWAGLSELPPNRKKAPSTLWCYSDSIWPNTLSFFSLIRH